MTSSNIGFRCCRASLMLSAVLLMWSLTGCQTSNFYYASSMPRNLRLVAQQNPQEVDLSKLAWASGGSETIGPGDLLKVSIAASLDKDDQDEVGVRVRDDGTAVVPRLGALHLAGFEPQAAEALIRQKSVDQGLYVDPTVTISFTSKKKNYVRVLGAVNDPGLHELPPNASDIVSAIAQAGGLSENAGTNVEIQNPINSASRNQDRRLIAGGAEGPFTAISDSKDVTESGGMRAYTVSLTSAAKSVGNRYRVEDGGVVMVEKRDPAPIHVGGLVKSAGEFEVPVGKPLTVLKAVDLAGGISNQLANKVYVIRPLANGESALIQVSLRKAKRNPKEDILLGPGDKVSVEQTPGTVFMEALQLIRFGVSGNTALF